MTTEQEAFEACREKDPIDIWRAALAYLRSQGEPVEIDWPEYNAEAMGCGLEDRGITDRYEAMRYGWDEAMERVAERLPEPLYLAPVAKLPAGWQLVPKEPTPNQKSGGLNSCADTELDPSWEELTTIYSAMLAAAPEYKE